VPELLSFISVDWIKPLAKRLQRIWEKRSAQLAAISNTFGDPRPLASCYIEPRVQHHNPADYHEDEDAISYVRAPAFETINRFLSGDTPVGGGQTKLFILSDAGMGKTSLLLMLELAHLFSFWPRPYRCELLKLGPDSLDTIQSHADKGSTVLLLDALDEDPLAWGRIEARLVELLQASEHYRRVIISCRTQFFPEAGADPFGRPGRVEIGGYTCPMLFLSLFDEVQVEQYLRRRFPDGIADRLLMRPNPRRSCAEQMVRPMRSLRFRPLLLAYVENIIGKEQDLLAGSSDSIASVPGEQEEWNAYRLYDALVQAWLLREERKLAKQLEDPPTKEVLLDLCTFLAVQLQVIGKRTLAAEEIVDLTARHPAMVHLRDFDVGGRSLLNRNAEGEYRFSHYSIQEFLVTRALSVGALDLLEGMLTLDTAAPAWQTKALRVLEPAQRLRFTDQMLEFLAHTPVVLDAAAVDLSNVRPESRVGIAIRDRLDDGASGPVMQCIPAGTFRMGSTESDKEAYEDERPEHTVTSSASFYLARCPVTFEELDRFCAATGRERPSDAGWGRGSRPVINVCWVDAVAYCDWLSAQTGQRYRLPTEAEWELAARAGSRTRWSFGDQERDLEHYAWYNKNAGGRTHPVGEKRPNAWGLFDCHGNVWEWVQDTWHEGYEGAPMDGSAWESDEPGASRVIRGGSWVSDAGDCRSTSRLRLEPEFRGHYLGFRCARDQV